MPHRDFPPIRPFPFADVVKAAEWALKRAEEGRNMPDLSRNPNSKLAVIKRLLEEVVRNRRQIEYLVVENAVLRDLLPKDPSCQSSPAQCSSTTPAVPTPIAPPPA